MLSYRHAYHAGSHADVLKHITLIATIEALMRKGKPLFYLETHAGAGIYDLSSDASKKIGEFEQGIGKLWAKKHRQQTIVKYIDIIRRANHEDNLHFYPGSPWFAKAVLGENRMALSELHGSDYAILSDLLRPYHRHIKTHKQDGLHTLKSLLPPPERRGLIFIDPPYEIKGEYQAVVDAVREGLKRFATGVYVIWYPLLKSGQQDTILRGLAALDLPYAKVELKVAQKDVHMYGSGLIILNPPYGLAQTLNEIINELIPVLGR